MEPFTLAELEQVIVAAKAATYIGDGQKLLPYRLGSKDLQFAEGDWRYHDSYFGDANFIGEEVVYFRGEPVWGMNYMGYLLQPELISAAQVGQMLKRSLSQMYTEGRFLGGFRFEAGPLAYFDTSKGQVDAFQGEEWVTMEGEVAYRLYYHGGLIR